MATNKTTNGFHEEETKQKKVRLRVGDPDFVPPDGRWGWLVVLACGFSNLSTFTMYQQFGLVFRDKFAALGITNTEMTTIINLNSAFNACVGLLNGPLFRRFSYRQVAFFGSLLVTTSLFITTFCQSFWSYLIFFAIFYGSGIGINQSANALALNTYFKTKRRVATGFSWTTTGLGPIVWPYIITALIGLFEMEGTLLIFSAFAGHAIVGSLLLQPVHWHTKFREDPQQFSEVQLKDTESGYFEGKSRRPSFFSSQYLYNVDDSIHTGYDISDQGTPRIVHANDGWFSNDYLGQSRMSIVSITSNKSGSRMASGQNSRAMSTRPSYNNLIDARAKKNSFNLAQDLRDRMRKVSYQKPTIKECEAEDSPMEKAPQDLKEEDRLALMTQTNQNELLKSAAERLVDYQQNGENSVQEDEEITLNFCQKFVIFFDLDLLKDKIYVNIMLGITIANFAEINFSILTPFVLKEFGFENYQVATFMSLLGAIDIMVRFFAPFLADKVGWDNRSFFLVGVLSMAFGRIILVHTQVFSVSLAVAVIIGFGKGLRTIFMALVIPSHVPLERLPAASGLHLATSGLVFLFLGPVIGWIRDAVDNYVITLHLLNVMTYITLVAWVLESLLQKKNKGGSVGKV